MNESVIITCAVTGAGDTAHRHPGLPISDAKDVIINLTTGMGNTWVVDDSDLTKPGVGSEFVGPEERVEHLRALQPEICSLDCGTMNFGPGNGFEVNIPYPVRQMARLIRDSGVKAELELFDLGQLVLLASRPRDRYRLSSRPTRQCPPISIDCATISVDEARTRVDLRS